MVLISFVIRQQDGRGEKRLYGDIDAGYISINATAGLSGEVVYRKVTSTTAAGQSILMDTNNSTNDFKCQHR